MDKRYAVCDSITGEVKNCIVWDGVTEWKPPAGHYVVQHDAVNIGDVHNKMHDVIVFADRVAKDPIIIDPEVKPYIAVPENPLNT